MRHTAGSGDSRRPSSAGFACGIFLLLVLGFTACVALVNFRRIFKPFLIVLFMAASVASHFIFHSALGLLGISTAP